jgi:hypothetical protein
MVASKTTCEGVWFKRFLEELGFSQERNNHTIDNQTSIALIKNPIHHNKTKYIGIFHHYMRKMVISKKK